MQKVDISYADIEKAYKHLLDTVVASGVHYSAIIAVGRNGAAAGLYLANKLGLPLSLVAWGSQTTTSYTMQDQIQLEMLCNRFQFRHVLFVDEILESGNTLRSLNEATKGTGTQMTWDFAVTFFLGKDVDSVGLGASKLMASYKVVDAEAYMNFPWDKGHKGGTLPEGFAVPMEIVK